MLDQRDTRTRRPTMTKSRTTKRSRYLKGKELKVQDACLLHTVPLHPVEKPMIVRNFLNLIAKELIINFGKTPQEARRLISRAEVPQEFKHNPISLHASPHEWAINVLTKNNDFNTLEQYYSD